MSDDGLVARAAAFARAIHRDDRRKGTGRSYFDAHLAPVAELVRDHGGSDEQVAAAYLHDTVEDGGGLPVLDEIRRRFGSDVAAMVADLSDSFVDTTSGQEKEEWIVRKARYLDGLAAKPARSLEVSIADKVDNANAILTDLEQLGDALWERFNRPDPAAHAWYYARLVEVFEECLPDHPLTPRLRAAVEALRSATGVDQSAVEAVQAEAQGAT